MTNEVIPVYHHDGYIWFLIHHHSFSQLNTNHTDFHDITTDSSSLEQLASPMVRAPKSGYARLAQEDELHNSSDEEDDLETGLSRSGRTPSYQQQTTSLLHSQSSRHVRGVGRMRSSSSGVDIKAINARLERWADEIRDKLKIGKPKDKNAKEQPLEIYYSVFVAPEGMKPVTADYEGYDAPPYNVALFDEVVESVRTAIRKGVQPKLITQGSSGSYFARNTDGEIVAVFKPKDEEPYGKYSLSCFQIGDLFLGSRKCLIYSEPRF